MSACWPSLGEPCGECHRCEPTPEVLDSATAKLETGGFRMLTNEERLACVWAVRAQRRRT